MTERKRQTPRIAILASGSGTTAEAFIHATQRGILEAEVGLLVCNNPQAPVIERVAALQADYGLDIKTAIINGYTHPRGAQFPTQRIKEQTEQESEAICNLLQSGGYGHVALMGYTKRVNGPLLEEFGHLPEHGSNRYLGRMSGTHPGPLPATAGTFGVEASRQALEASRAQLAAHKPCYTAHTVHLISAEVDMGPVIARHEVTIRPEDTPESLFGRVQDVEREMLPTALDNFLQGQQFNQAA